jgi:hypothetical protein
MSTNQPYDPYLEPDDQSNPAPPYDQGGQLPTGPAWQQYPPPSNTTHVVGWPVSTQPVGPTNGLAVAALVLGIVWAFWIGSALAIVFGHVALGQIRQRNQSGKGMAVAGLVLGYVGAGTFALFVVLPLLLGAGG